MRWFRFYDEVLDDPKCQRLPPVLFKHWVNLLCLASREPNRGALPSVKDVSFGLRLSEAKIRSILADLVTAGLIDVCDDGTFRPHGWDKRQRASDNVAERVTKHRDRNEDVTLQETLQVTLQDQECNVTETVPRARATEQSRTDTEQSRAEGGGKQADADAPPPAPPETRPVPKARATRIPEPFVVTDEMREWASSKRMPPDLVDFETERFMNYYRSESGVKATKLDWPATWRNWLLRDFGKPNVTPLKRPPNGYQKDIGYTTDELIAMSREETP